MLIFTSPGLQIQSSRQAVEQAIKSSIGGRKNEKILLTLLFQLRDFLRLKRVLSIIYTFEPRKQKSAFFVVINIFIF